MLSRRNFTIYIILIGIYAGIICVFAELCSKLGFVSKETNLAFLSFLGWTMFYLLGATAKKARKAICCIGIGALVAVGIFIISNIISFALPTENEFLFVSLPVATAIGTVVLAASERFKHFNVTPAVFAGCGLFFAMMGAYGMQDSTTYVFNVIGELTYVSFGMLIGWVSVKTKDQLLKRQSKTNKI